MLEHDLQPIRPKPGAGARKHRIPTAGCAAIGDTCVQNLNDTPKRLGKEVEGAVPNAGFHRFLGDPDEC
jgi:hypothetical protein